MSSSSNRLLRTVQLARLSPNRCTACSDCVHNGTLVSSEVTGDAPVRFTTTSVSATSPGKPLSFSRALNARESESRSLSSRL